MIQTLRYFGQGQGIGACTFVDERHLLWHSPMISSADRESAYVIDGLMRNDVVKSDIHSTDTRGCAEAVFGLTHLLGFSFSPCIKGIDRLTRHVFKPMGRAEDNWVIRPDKAVNEKPVHRNRDDLLRLAATIKFRASTASDIFRRSWI